MEKKIVIDVSIVLQQLNIHNVSYDLFLSRPQDQIQEMPAGGPSLCSMLVEQVLQAMPGRVV